MECDGVLIMVCRGDVVVGSRVDKLLQTSIAMVLEQLAVVKGRP